MSFRSLLLLSLLAPAFAAAQPNGPPNDVPRGGGKTDNKILVCHLPGDAKETIKSVGLDDLADHALHGDYQVVDTDEDGFSVLESLASPGTFCTGTHCDTLCAGPRDCNDGASAINPDASDADCNAVDDDCSGSADDEYVAPATSCGTGECASAGLATCVAGSIVDTCDITAKDTLACGDSTDTICNAQDSCDTGVCVSNFAPSGTSCGAASGLCDLADTCDGVGTCVDNVKASGAECRAAAGTCDVAESCDGASSTCPTDAFLPGTTVCREAAGACDVADSCTGSTAACPADAFESSSTVCRAADGACDVAESCDGASAGCPTDAFASSDTLARPTRGVCDAPDFCSGSSKIIPLDVTNAGSVCRPSVGVCDPVAEICQSGSDDCPADVRIPAGTECAPLEGAAACEIYTCGDDGTCSFARNRAASASCRAPADAQCDARDLCGVLTYKCSGDLTTSCTTNGAPDDSKCQVGGVDNGRCAVDPYDPRNRTDFTSAWSQIQVTPDLTITFPPANDTGELYLTEFNSYPDCGPDTVKPKDTACTSDGGAGRCLDGACNRFYCRNTLECPDGSVCGCPSGEVCETDYCIPAPVDNGYGDSCTGVSGSDAGTCTGLLCCAGMEGDGNGAVAGVGVAGRCAECCSTIGTDDCGGGAQCCDGECTDIESDPENCLGCNYDGGVNCHSLTNSCNPGVVKCDPNIGSGCVMEESCEAEAAAGGWAGWDCDVPQVEVPDPACDYCVLPTPTPGKPCLEDAECGGYPGSCFRDPSLFCFAAGTHFRVADECLDPPYTGCTPVCTERSNPANVGAECAGDEDCREGTTCKTTCDLSELWLSAFCVSQPTCQW